MTDFSLQRRALSCIAQGSLTDSKRPEVYVKGVYPTHVSKGQGCWLWDHQGKKYLDFMSGHGTNILGYANSQVNQAISQQLFFGISHSLGTHHELDAAEKVKELFPFVDAVQFFKSRVDARDAAHLLGLQRQQNRIFVEPDPCDLGRLNKIRDDCTTGKALLIFDEVETAFRIPKYSVAGYTGINPDMIILGGAMANGSPLFALGAKYGVMNCGPTLSSDFGGETLSLVAATTTMTLLQTKHDLNALWGHGQQFMDQFNALWPEKLRLEGIPTRGIFVGDPLTKALFWQEACLAGMLFGPVVYFNFPLAEEYKNAMGAISAIMGRIKNGEVTLKGEMPR